MRVHTVSELRGHPHPLSARGRATTVPLPAPPPEERAYPPFGTWSSVSSAPSFQEPQYSHGKPEIIAPCQFLGHDNQYHGLFFVVSFGAILVTSDTVFRKEPAQPEATANWPAGGQCLLGRQRLNEPERPWRLLPRSEDESLPPQCLGCTFCG